MLLLAVDDEVTAGAGPLGLLIIVLLAIATILLIRNMNARLKRMPRSFDPPPAPDEPPPPATDEPR